MKKPGAISGPGANHACTSNLGYVCHTVKSPNTVLHSLVVSQFEN